MSTLPVNGSYKINNFFYYIQTTDGINNVTNFELINENIEMTNFE